MARHQTIIADLNARIDRFQARYGERPTKVPVTLDEWAWLSDWLALATGDLELEPVTHFQGLPIQFVEDVVNTPDGGIKVRA